MRHRVVATLCSILLGAATTVGAHADATVSIAPPRPAGQFVYGTHISAVDHASLANQDGFKLMWAYVPWEQVEPERGTFLFRKQDKWGQPLPNALTNVVSAAAGANMKLILRIDEVPGWAGGNPAHLDPADLEAYLYETVRYGKGTIQYVEVFNEVPMCFRDVERFRNVMLQNGDANKQAFITEMGVLAQTSNDLGPYAWMELPADTRGDYLVRALQMANGNYPWIRGAMVFNFDYATVPWNASTSEKYWFSLTTNSPAGAVESEALQRFKQARASGLLP